MDGQFSGPMVRPCFSLPAMFLYILENRYKACRVPRSAVSPMNCSWKYLIGVEWMMNIVGTTDVDGTIYCKFAEDGDMLCLNGQLT